MVETSTSTVQLEGSVMEESSLIILKELQGIISRGGYFCGCSLFNFSRVLSAYEFEWHVGVKTRHPNNHIYLENGRPIYSIIQELKTAPLSILDDSFKTASYAFVKNDLKPSIICYSKVADEIKERIKKTKDEKKAKKSEVMAKTLKTREGQHF
ncbi:hypothetical protein FNV43_RR15456 [Rhamnella rubrinervis]|uniref:Tify domain-containing protein n=1 Tax=Rhamnella rubrinervis TaxID=2594499 RepID=A0A8K0E1K6_9ROSA|nr:hypothetical protein FNV43_RR15456 [Rhamnella rubrinervis]